MLLNADKRKMNTIIRKRLKRDKNSFFMILINTKIDTIGRSMRIYHYNDRTNFILMNMIPIHGYFIDTCVFIYIQ